MDIYSTIEKELFDNRAVAAFIWLIENGRELELSYKNVNVFISRDGSKEKVSLWINKKEQAFNSVEDLFERATIGTYKLCEVWQEVELGVLY